MANYLLPASPVYHDGIQQLCRSDPADAELTFNPLIQQLVENIHYVYCQVESTAAVTVPLSRTVNGKALTSDITLSAVDVHARPDTWTPTAAEVGARPADWTPTAANVGAVPTSRKVNGKALSADISLSTADVGASNPNLLDNWYFADPVNQRGQTEYTMDGYTIDRWKTSNIDVFLVDGAVNIKTRTGSSSYKRFFQHIEGEWKAGTYLTLSALVNVHSVLGNVTIRPSNYYSFLGGAKSITTTGIQLITLSLATSGDVADGKLTAFEFWADHNIESAFDIDVMALKTELGDHQTLAHQDTNGNWVLNDPPPNKALELAKCQRYQIFRHMRGYKIWDFHTGQVGVFFPTPVTMRTMPTVVGKIVFVQNGIISSAECTSRIQPSLMKNGIYLYLSGTNDDYTNVNFFSCEEGSGFDANL